MKKYKFGLCGHFDEKHTAVNGQTVKTVNVACLLEEKYGVENVLRLDTYEFKKNPISFLLKYIKFLKHSENVILFPAHNAVQVLVPIAISLKSFLNCSLYYVVIGAWIGKLLKKNPVLKKSVKGLDGIFVETNILKKELELMEIANVVSFPNFKRIDALPEEKLVYFKNIPFKICFCSKVMPEKGIEELIQAVKNINKEETKYVLDIYGAVESSYRERFETLEKDFPEYIKYKGVIPPLETVGVIKDYFLQAFPTKFPTEGHPGSIIDSYNAGVPVIASRWNSWADIIDEGETGLTYEFGKFEQLEELLKRAAENPEEINKMKKKCLERAEDYKPEKVIKILTDKMGC